MADKAESGDAIHIVVHNGIITFVGSNCLDATGHPPEYFHGRHVHELMHPEDRTRLDRTFAPGWTGRFSERFRLPDGSGGWTWQRAEGVRTQDTTGQLHTVMELTVDRP